MKEIENEHFSDLTLSGECIADTEFIDCVFENCTLDSIDFENCVFTECMFRSCQAVNCRSFASQMRSSVFESCTLVQVNWRTWQPHSIVMDVFDRFTDCNLRYNWFEELNLTRFSFVGNRLSDSMFSDCKLSKSSFRDCPMQNTEFFRCDLQGADFRDATGYKIGLSTNKLKGAMFSSPEVLSLLSETGIKIE